jgi:hypothetical protein
MPDVPPLVVLGKCWACSQPVDDHHLIIDEPNLIAAAMAGKSDLRYFSCPGAKKEEPPNTEWSDQP